MVSVLGLTNQTAARSYARQSNRKIDQEEKKSDISPEDGPQNPQYFSGFYPPQVAALYSFPPNTDGKGQSIAILELGGGYVTSDLATYFKAIGVPLPESVPISVDGATNNPTGPTSGDNGEVNLDIEVASGVAPGANICVYFAPNTYGGFYDSIAAIINDTKYKPKIISISWGSGEKNWSYSAMLAMNSIFQKAANSGISTFVSAGDHLSTDGISDGLTHVDFPASDSFCTGVGGTTLTANLQANPPYIISETVWHDANGDGWGTGGGISDYVALPSWQQQNLNPLPTSADPDHHTLRCVPDVASVGDENTGYRIYFGGTWHQFGGTSAGSPLWAGLTARINQALNKNIGFINPIIYLAQNHGYFHDITVGNNVAYSAKVGYDLCSGWGSPNGTLLLNAFK